MFFKLRTHLKSHGFLPSPSNMAFLILSFMVLMYVL